MNKDLTATIKRLASYPDNLPLQEVDALCDRIYGKLQKLKIIPKSHRQIKGQWLIIKDMNDKVLPDSYWFMLTETGKIFIARKQYYSQIGCWKEVKTNWKSLDYFIKMRLIDTLPGFLKQIEKDYADLSQQMKEFVNKFKNIN